MLDEKFNILRIRVGQYCYFRYHGKYIRKSFSMKFIRELKCVVCNHYDPKITMNLLQLPDLDTQLETLIGLFKFVEKLIYTKRHLRRHCTNLENFLKFLVFV